MSNHLVRPLAAGQVKKQTHWPALATGLLAAVVLMLFGVAAAQQAPKAPQILAIDGQAVQVTHDFTQLPLTSDGWTDFQAMLQSPGYANARVVFVSSSAGNDASATVYGVDAIRFDERGMFQPAQSVQAYRTLSAAYAQIRSGYPDILLLRRGDEWSEGFTRGEAGRIKSGRNIVERHIVASYGAGDRPRLYAAMIDARDASYTVVSGLHLYENDWRTAGRALDITGAVNHQLYEDIRFERKSEDKIQGGSSGVSNVAIRRSFYSHYQAHDGFVYVARVDGLLFEENVYYEPWRYGAADESAHGRLLYLSPSGSGDDKNALRNVILRRNLGFRAERGGFDARGGGLLEDNTFIAVNDTGFGGNGGSRESIQSGAVIYNVFMQGTPNSQQNNALHIRSIDGGRIEGNIWTDSRNVGQSSNNVILMAPFATEAQYQVLRNITISGNIIYDWGSPGQGRALDLSGGYTTVENIVIERNDWQFLTGSAEIVRHRDWTDGAGNRFDPFTYVNNRYASAATSSVFMPGDNFNGWVAASGETESVFEIVADYPDPSRTIDTYMRSLDVSGGAKEFMGLALNQSRMNWNAAFTANSLNNYIREGFGRNPR